MSDSLQPHGLQHARLLCPSPTPGACSNSHPSSWWFHPGISSSVIPFSFCFQSFPASGSFPMRQFFTSGGQRIGASASASVLPMNIQNWFPLGWTGWISLLSKGLSRVFSNTTVQKHQFFSAQLYDPTLTSIHDYWKNHSFDNIWTFVGKVMSLLFNMLSRLVIAFLPRSKCLLISSLQLPSAVILETKKIKSLTVFIVSPSICHEVMGPDAMILVWATREASWSSWLPQITQRNLIPTPYMRLRLKGPLPESWGCLRMGSFWARGGAPNTSAWGSLWGLATFRSSWSIRTWHYPINLVKSASQEHSVLGCTPQACKPCTYPASRQKQ